MTEVLFNTISHEYHSCTKVYEWDFVQSSVDRVRVYYKPSHDGDGNGFSFYALEEIGGLCTDESEDICFLPASSHVECIYQGHAYFDGIRHLYMGDEKTENYGYHYYPKIEVNIEVLKIIRELEVKYCRDLD